MSAAMGECFPGAGQVRWVRYFCIDYPNLNPRWPTPENTPQVQQNKLQSFFE